MNAIIPFLLPQDTLYCILLVMHFSSKRTMASIQLNLKTQFREKINNKENEEVY